MKTLKELASKAHEIRRSADSRGERQSDGSIVRTSTDHDLSSLSVVVAEIADSIGAIEFEAASGDFEAGGGGDDLPPDLPRAKFLRPVEDRSPPSPPTPPVIIPGVEPAWNDDARLFVGALMREDAEGRTAPEEIIASAATMADLLAIERAARGGTRLVSPPGLPQMIAEWKEASPTILAEFERFMVQLEAAQRRVAAGLRAVKGGGGGDGSDGGGGGGGDGKETH